MTILVGYGPEARGRGGLGLAKMLSQSSGLPLVVCCVVPDRWQPVGPGRAVDSRYQEYLLTQADEAVASAAKHLGQVDAGVEFDVITARSAPTGLLSAAERHHADMLVVGSSAHGAWGHIALGSVTDRLLHSSPLPVALAPRGQRFRLGERVHRVTVAFDGSSANLAVLAQAARVAKEVGATLRVVIFAVRAGMMRTGAGAHIEDDVVAAWRDDACAAVEAARSSLDPELGTGAEMAVAEASTWADALDEPGWEPGDVLVVGSSPGDNLLTRVFLGSTATRIIRHSPVPVVVVP